MTNQLQRLGLTPAKAALMAVLAFGLVVVWGPAISQLLGGKSGTQRVTSSQTSVAKPTGRASAASAVTQRTPQRPASNAKPSAARARQSPAITVAEASEYDPFAPPAWSPSSHQLASTRDAVVEPSELESRFENLRQTGIAMILVSRDGKAAQLGDQTLRVGDTIDGFEVIEITADGVTFKPAPPETEGGARGA